MNLTETKLELYKERDMGQMMGFAATLVRRHWKHMFRTIGLMSLPLMLMASTLYYLGSSTLMEGFDLALGQVPTNPINPNLLFAYLAIYITYTVILWGTVYYVQLYDEKGPENFQWNDIWAKVFAHGWWLLLSNILIFLIIGVLMAISFMLIITILLAPIALILVTGLAALAQVWTVVYLYEADGLFTAFDRSFKLLKKQWFRAIGLLICSYMVVSGFIMLPAMLGFAGGFLSGNIGFDETFLEDSLWLILLIQNLSTILGYFTTFFISLSFTAFYLSNVERMEKVSLRARIEHLSEHSSLTSYT